MFIHLLQIFIFYAYFMYLCYIIIFTGTVIGSRQEYHSNTGRLKMKYEFSLEFKTTYGDGIIFYIADNDKHIDFIGLYLKDGKVNTLIQHVLEIKHYFILCFQ